MIRFRYLQMVNGIGFRRLVGVLLQLGQHLRHDSVDELLPDPTTISRNLGAQVHAIQERMKPEVKEVTLNLFYFLLAPKCK